MTFHQGFHQPSTIFHQPVCTSPLIPPPVVEQGRRWWKPPPVPSRGCAGDLVLQASAPPPRTVIDLLSRHKTKVLSLLRPADDGWSAQDWQNLFDERAGVAEFDSGLPRAQAKLRRPRNLLAIMVRCSTCRSYDSAGPDGHRHPRCEVECGAGLVEGGYV
jgi:hypothetical protein